MAAGVFAPGHLDELTRIVPFELADAVLEETRTRERRLRVLPSRVGLYFVLALGLFPQAGYLAVWAELTAALDGLGLTVSSSKALRGLRRRLGPAPLRALFEVPAEAAPAGRSVISGMAAAAPDQQRLCGGGRKHAAQIAGLADCGPVSPR